MRPGPYIWLWALCLFAGCSAYLKQPNIVSAGGSLPLATSNTSQPLEVTFNGVTCFILRYGNSVVLTDPFVSNPGAKQLLFGEIHPDTALVNAAYNTQDLADTKLVLISHAHYDHLMDLPPRSMEMSARCPGMALR